MGGLPSFDEQLAYARAYKHVAGDPELAAIHTRIDLIEESRPAPAYPLATGDEQLMRNSQGSANEAADCWFRRGMVWLVGFHPEEAVECFNKAIALEPEFAMPHLGLALANGPNYNTHGARYLALIAQPEDGQVYSCQMMLEHATKAVELAAKLSPAEADMSVAEKAQLPARLDLPLAVAVKARADGLSAARAYSDRQTAFERAERKFADQLRELVPDWPEDPDLRWLLASALMNLCPWKLWNPTDSTPRCERQPAEDTLEIAEHLEAGLAAQPRHPGLCHMWIHLHEMAPDPAMALPQARMFAQPGYCGAAGHLNHMAAHIFGQVGLYQEAIDADLLAVASDEQVAAVGLPGAGIYRRYFAHNLHKTMFDAMWAANLPVASQAAGKLRALISEETVRARPEDFEPMFSIHFHMKVRPGPGPAHLAQVRFGLWDEILAEPTLEPIEFFAATHVNQTQLARLAIG